MSVVRLETLDGIEIQALAPEFLKINKCSSIFFQFLEQAALLKTCIDHARKNSTLWEDFSWTHYQILANEEQTKRSPKVSFLKYHVEGIPFSNHILFVKEYETYDQRELASARHFCLSNDTDCKVTASRFKEDLTPLMQMVNDGSLFLQSFERVVNEMDLDKIKLFYEKALDFYGAENEVVLFLGAKVQLMNLVRPEICIREAFENIESCSELQEYYDRVIDTPELVTCFFGTFPSSYYDLLEGFEDYQVLKRYPMPCKS